MSGASLATKGVGFTGSSVTTKGLLGPVAASIPDVASTLTLPPGFGLRPAPVTRLVGVDADVVVVIPTAINTCLIAAENITDNLRAQQASDLELPSFYKRAFLIAYETDEIALVRK